MKIYIYSYALEEEFDCAIEDNPTADMGFDGFASPQFTGIHTDAGQAMIDAIVQMTAHVDDVYPKGEDYRDFDHITWDHDDWETQEDRSRIRRIHAFSDPDLGADKFLGSIVIVEKEVS